MRNLDIIVKEIVELSEIKSAYNHYLASHRSLTEVENTTQVQNNRKIILQSLKILREEAKHEKAKAISDKALETSQLNITLNYNNNEKNAIFHFNRDKRFTITE